jgi:hypothetical protein
MGGQHCGASVPKKPLTTSVSLASMTITKLFAFIWQRCAWNDFSAQIYHGIIDLVVHNESITIVARTDGRYSANTPP